MHASLRDSLPLDGNAIKGSLADKGGLPDYPNLFLLPSHDSYRNWLARITFSQELV